MRATEAGQSRARQSAPAAAAARLPSSLTRPFNHPQPPIVDVGRLAQHLPRLKATIDKGLLPASFQRVYDDALAILERQK